MPSARIHLVAVIAGAMLLGLVACHAPGSQPASVDEAVARTLVALDAQERHDIAYMGREDLVSLHFGLGMWMRNAYGLWQGNRRLLRDCGTDHPDDCSGVILDALWDRLRMDLPSAEREALERLEAQMARLAMPRLDLREVTVAQLAARISEAVALQLPAGDRFGVRVDPDYADGRLTWTDPEQYPFPEALMRLDANTFVAVRKQPPDLVLEPDLWPLAADLPRGAVLTPRFSTSSGLREEKHELVTDAASWSVIWRELSRRSGSAEPQPDVDFSRHSVLVVALGRRSSGGFEIEVEAHGARAGAGVFSIVEHEPGPHCLATATLTWPTRIYILPAPLASARFLQGYKTRDCG